LSGIIVFCEHGNVAQRGKTYTKSMEMENTYNRNEKEKDIGILFCGKYSNTNINNKYLARYLPFYQ
jgi:hypothetical protein